MEDVKMDVMYFTNLVLKKGYEKGLYPELLLGIDDSHEEPSPQVQINIENDVYDYFALFYGLKDDSINYSCIFEIESKDNLEKKMLTNLSKDLKEVFEQDKGIFDDLIVSDDGNTIDLYKKIKKEELTEEVVDEILDFLSNKISIKVLEYIK